MNPVNNKVRLYTRVSTQEQANEGVSIDAQLSSLNAYASSQGWLVTGEDIDAGYSGGTDDRPGLKHLLMDARKGEFNIIAVTKLDRFFRNLRLLLNYIHEFETLGIKFVSTQEMLDTSTPHGKFAVQIMGVIAEFERQRIGERIREGRAYRTSQGNWTAGRTPYGFKWLPREQKWEVIEEEAKIVRHIYDLYLKEKLGMMHIPLRLNEENIRTRDGGTWHFSSVHKILSQSTYKGLHFLGFKMPEIIDVATWDKAQQQRNNARHIRGESRNWLLQGMCVCGLCGHTLHCSQKKGKKSRYYICRGKSQLYHADGSAKCTLHLLKADELEMQVWWRVKSAINDPEVMNEYIHKALVELEEKMTQTNADR